MNAIAQHFMRKDGTTTVGAEKVSDGEAVINGDSSKVTNSSPFELHQRQTSVPRF